MSSPGADPLVNIRAKIERAKKHIGDLDVTIRAFLDSNPYKVGTKRDLDTRKLIYYVAHADDVPTDITQIAGDAICGLVSILDHLAFRLYRKNTPSGDGRRVQFPISRDATTLTEHESTCQGKVKGIAPDVGKALCALEAYKGGKGHQLWVLNELNNLSKHRDLIAVGSRFRSVDLGAHMTAMMEQMFGMTMPGLPAFFKPSDPLCPLQIGDELLIGAPDEETNEKMQFAFDVALNEPQIIQAEPLVETIHHLAGLVDSTVAQFAVYL